MDKLNQVSFFVKKYKTQKCPKDKNSLKENQILAFGYFLAITFAF